MGYMCHRGVAGLGEQVPETANANTQTPAKHGSLT